ncbi:MAG TPA: NUDIX domain-containing protein [Geminicoccaceae bacterium]|nr:NUDIX domain-containing protein [Geminicoccaceae bacterium]
MTPESYEILERREAHRGFFRLEVLKLRHALFRGGTSPVLTRELFHQRRAVTVLPYHAPRDEVVLIEQFRVGAIEADGRPWLLEAPAGMVEAGETVEAVARREVQEECGIEIGRLERAHDYLSSPGCTTERVSVFIGEATAPHAGGIFGEPEEAEDIRSHAVPAEQAFAWLREGRLTAVTAVITLQYLMLHRDRLRREWQAVAAPPP